MLGEFLIKKDFVSKGHVEEALLVQKYSKQKLGRLLVELGHLSKEKLNSALHLYLNADIEESALNLKEQIKNAPADEMLLELARNAKALVLNVAHDRVEFISTYFDDEFLERVEIKIGKHARVFVVNHETFDFLKTPNSSKGAESTKHSMTVTEYLNDDEKLSQDTPYAHLFFECVKTAKELRASDIHIAPTARGVDINFRLNGVLNLWKHLKNDHKESFISKVKWIVNMNLGVVGRPQDSRASFKLFKVDMRASSLPLLHGEKIVLRLLNREQNFNLSDSGLDSDAILEMKRAIIKRDGLILISGPTGSGKTTTLYSLLCEIDRKKKNISTLENPVEYELEGINQVNITDVGELTFSNALRALMRQDPDVILVGEIRDQETANLCFKAASTGHLVLSTVHANGAREVVERLTNLGVDPFTIKSNLRFSAAQRLVRRLCPICALRPEDNTIEDVKRECGDFLMFDCSKLRVINDKGCEHCIGGVIGRKAILEYMRAIDIENYLQNPKNNKNALTVMLKQAALKLAFSSEIDAQELLEIS